MLFFCGKNSQFETILIRKGRKGRFQTLCQQRVLLMTSFLSSYIYAKDHIFRFFSLPTLKFVWSQVPFKITDENNFFSVSSLS